MARNSLLSGKKFNGRHTAYIKDSESLLKVLKTSSHVTKIVIGEVKPLKKVVKKEERVIKIFTVPAGLRLVYRGFNARQVFFVYTQDRDSVRNIVQQSLKE